MAKQHTEVERCNACLRFQEDNEDEEDEENEEEEGEDDIDRLICPLILKSTIECLWNAHNSLP